MSAQYPDAPDAPGVPPVNRDASNADATTVEGITVTANASNLSYQSPLPQWGLYDDNNQPVVVSDSFVRFEFTGDAALPDYPTEDGGFQTFNKVQKPFRAKITLAKGGSIADRQVFLTDIEAAKQSLELFTVLTPERAYPSVNVEHYDFIRTSQNGVTLLLVTIHLLEIRVTATAAFTNTQTPGGANTVNNGAAQPAAPTQVQAMSVADGFA